MGQVATASLMLASEGHARAGVVAITGLVPALQWGAIAGARCHVGRHWAEWTSRPAMLVLPGALTAAALRRNVIARYYIDTR